jgi:hypothetical protein
MMQQCVDEKTDDLVKNDMRCVKRTGGSMQKSLSAPHTRSLTNLAATPTASLCPTIVSSH